MGVANNPSVLPDRKDLDRRVDINPDEAGLIELMIDGRSIDDEVDLLIDTATDPNDDIWICEYARSKPGEKHAYEAWLIGYPADSELMSRWTIRFFIKE